MNLLEADENNPFSVAPFAAQPFYTTVNRSLVQQALARHHTSPLFSSVNKKTPSKNCHSKIVTTSPEIGPL